MGIRKINWSRKATTNFHSILQWYQTERGPSYASKFFIGILSTIELIAKMPTIGIVEEKISNSKITYYSFLSHPKYRIIYRYTNTDLFIVAIRSTQMKK